MHFKNVWVLFVVSKILKIVMSDATSHFITQQEKLLKRLRDEDPFIYMMIERECSSISQKVKHLSIFKAIAV